MDIDKETGHWLLGENWIENKVQVPAAKTSDLLPEQVLEASSPLLKDLKASSWAIESRKLLQEASKIPKRSKKFNPFLSKLTPKYQKLKIYDYYKPDEKPAQKLKQCFED